MNALERIGLTGIAPVVILDDIENALPTAKAMLAGGIDAMEITFRTEAAPEAIRQIREAYPEMLVGAGTIITLDQCKLAVEMGAQFIVAPSFDEEVVSWCVERDICILPGCVTPTELAAARKLGLRVVKFFPANIYGGLAAMKSLSGPFPDMKFVPTSGINGQNVGEHLVQPFIHAVGGSWLCSRKDIQEKNFEKITRLCSEARKAVLGYEVAHVGINCADLPEAKAVSDLFGDAFGFPCRTTSKSYFSTEAIEIMHYPFYGTRGHIGLFTTSVARAIADLEKKGFAVRPESVKYKNSKPTVAYLEQEFGGFAVHIMEK